MGEPPRNVTLVLLHIPKTGGSTVGSLFSANRRIFSVIPRPSPPLPAHIDYLGGHRSASILARQCNPRAGQCCVYMTVVRDPLERMASAMSTSREDHQHFDCPRDASLYGRLRRTPALTLQGLGTYDSHGGFWRNMRELQRCHGVNALLDQLAPPRYTGYHYSRHNVIRIMDRAHISRRLKLAARRLEAMQIIGVHPYIGETLRQISHTLGVSLPANFSSISDCVSPSP